MTFPLAARGSGHALLGLLLLGACGGSETPPGGAGGSGGTTGGAAGGATGGTAPSAGKGGSGAGGSAGSATSVGGAGGSGGQAPVAGRGGTNAGGTGTGTGGAPAGGSAGTTGGTGGGTSGGAGGTGGAAGSAVAGGMGGTAGVAGSGTGGMAGSSTAVWQCPAGVTTTPTLTGSPTRVTSVPPSDDFNMMNGNFGNVEGPVWIGDALYVSEMSFKAYTTQDGEVKMARILKVTEDGQTSIFVADSGSNGLAVDNDGNIVAAVHKDGSLTRFPLPSGAGVPFVTMFMGARFNSPNDLAIHTNGTIYFSDPNFQAPNSKPQTATRVYRVPMGGEAVPIPNGDEPDQFGNPNGVALSLTQDFLYVAASTGRRYPVMADGTLGDGTDFAATNGGDGMTIDCAGNIYVAQASAAAVKVFSSSGTPIGTINVSDVQSTTNVAFGGADHQTLYITGLGNNKGLFKLAMNLPGRPY